MLAISSSSMRHDINGPFAGSMTTGASSGVLSLSLSEGASSSTQASLASSSVRGPVSPALVSSHLPKSMLVEDDIHGTFNITEPVLIELLLSPPVERLRRVLQHGITALIGITPTPPVTRHEHSVGAMLLVRAAGGSVDAQAAALLHDIAHTALSHVVDSTFGYVVHEVDKLEYLNTTTILDILRKHGLDPEEVLEEANYPLLELDAPAICADRLDYGIRDSRSFGILSSEHASAISADLVASRVGRFCFKTLTWAKKLAEAYMQADEFAWSNPNHSLLYEYAANTIKLAHSTGEMQKCELWKSSGDDAFWRKMTESTSPEVRRLALRVKKTTRVEEIPESEYNVITGERYTETPKVRTIDPDVLQADGSVIKLSLLSEEYRLKREAYLARKNGVHWYRVIEV